MGARSLTENVGEIGALTGGKRPYDDGKEILVEADT